MTVVARLIGYDSMHELHFNDGKYSQLIYIRDRDADRELTLEEAGDWVDYVRGRGGLVCRRGEVDRVG